MKEWNEIGSKREGGTWSMQRVEVDRKRQASRSCSIEEWKWIGSVRKG